MLPVIAPREQPPPRLAPLARLPIFMDLADRRVVAIGGGEPMVWKTELLLASGARVDLYDLAPAPALLALAAGSEGALLVHVRRWCETDLDGAALIVADTEDEREAVALKDAARTRGVLLNVVDKPRFCDFQFGAIVNRSPIVIGISTDGAAPILGQAIRRRIEAVLPASLGAWATIAKAFRGSLAALLPARAERRAFWERFVDRAFAAGPTLTAKHLTRLAFEVKTERSSSAQLGSVAIVGAGPGDPELLTLRAMRELQAADVIVYDRLVTPEVLELGRREARRIHVGKEGHGAACRQEDISALLVDLALAGERIVRLKGGDPAVFGRTGEEVAACEEAGVPVRIVPGVTTASAAAASLNLSLTHRDHAQRITFMTGHDRHGDLPAEAAAAADPGTTLVVYMGRRTARKLATRLLRDGLSEDTPVLAMSDVSRPGETTLTATLADLRDGLPMPNDRPVLIMIGAALAARASPAYPKIPGRFRSFAVALASASS